MVDAMKLKRSIYFATLQGYVIFETKLYMSVDAKHSGKHSFYGLIDGLEQHIY